MSKYQPLRWDRFGDNLLGIPLFMRAFIASAVASCVIASGAWAQYLRFEFKIDAQISGSRPWDGTTASSSAVDGLTDGLTRGITDSVFGQGSFTGTLIGNAAEAAIGGAGDALLDEAQAGIAPPDPYLCIIEVSQSLPGTLRGAWTNNQGQYVLPQIFLPPGQSQAPPGRNFSATCTPNNEIKRDRLHFSLDLPPNLAAMQIFGVALIDNDLSNDGSQLGAYRDELIGFGLYIDDGVRQQVINRDPLTLQVIQIYETEVTSVVDELFGLTRGGRPGSNALEIEKLSAENCKISCRFGDADLKIKTSAGGY